MPKYTCPKFSVDTDSLESDEDSLESDEDSLESDEDFLESDEDSLESDEDSLESDEESESEPKDSDPGLEQEVTVYEIIPYFSMMRSEHFETKEKWIFGDDYIIANYLQRDFPQDSYICEMVKFKLKHGKYWFKDEYDCHYFIEKISDNGYGMHREKTSDPKYRKKLERYTVSDGYIGFKYMKSAYLNDE